MAHIEIIPDRTKAPHHRMTVRDLTDPESGDESDWQGECSCGFTDQNADNVEDAIQWAFIHVEREHE